jgi:transposase
MSSPRVWYDFYKAAVLETDPKKMKEKIQAAESAMRNRERILSKDHKGTPQERQSLADARRGLELVRKESAEWHESAISGNGMTAIYPD